MTHITVFKTPLSVGQAAYLRKALEEFPDVFVVAGESHPQWRPAHVSTHEQITDQMRARIHEAVHMAARNVNAA